MPAAPGTAARPKRATRKSPCSPKRSGIRPGWRSCSLLIQRGDCICGEIVDVLPLAQATVSQHLKVLKGAGLIQGDDRRAAGLLLRQPFGRAKVQRTHRGLVMRPEEEHEHDRDPGHPDRRPRKVRRHRRGQAARAAAAAAPRLRLRAATCWPRSATRRPRRRRSPRAPTSGSAAATRSPTPSAEAGRDRARPRLRRRHRLLPRRARGRSQRAA